MREQHPVDLLVSGDDEPDRPSPFTPRRLKAAAAVLLVLAAGAGFAELRERRAAAAEERRLARVVDLAATPEGGSSSYDPRTREVVLYVELRLRNAGPREVVVERGSAGSFALVQQLVEVGAGDDVALLLRRSLVCSPLEPPPADDTTALRLDLRTAAGPRSVELPVQGIPGVAETARACGFVPLEESVGFRIDAANATDDGTAELLLQVDANAPRAVQVTRVLAGPGLRPELLDAQGRPQLRRALPRGRSTSVVRLHVDDCGSAGGSRADGDPSLTLVLRDENGRVGQVEVLYAGAFLGSLLSDAC